MDKVTIQSIYGRGYRDGFRDGVQKMRREGWVDVEGPEELEPGDTVKILVPTFGGWQGPGTVDIVEPSGLVEIRKPNGETAHAMAHELAKKHVEKPLKP